MKIIVTFLCVLPFCLSTQNNKTNRKCYLIKTESFYLFNYHAPLGFEKYLTRNKLFNVVLVSIGIGRNPEANSLEIYYLELGGYA